MSFEVYKDVLTEKGPAPNILPNSNNYNEIYMDGNGSFAFYQDKYNIIKTFISNNFNKIKVISLMAGVEKEKEPLTQPPSAFLNRLQNATMNQVYSPIGFYTFMVDLLQTNTNTKIFATTNNEANEHASYFFDSKMEKSIGYKNEIFNSIKERLKPESDLGIEIIKNLFPNNEQGTLLNVINAFYKKGRESKQKLFDVASSLQLIECMNDPRPCHEKGFMIIDNKYGIAETFLNNPKQCLDIPKPPSDQNFKLINIYFTRFTDHIDFETRVKAITIPSSSRGGAIIRRFFKKYCLS